MRMIVAVLGLLMLGGCVGQGGNWGAGVHLPGVERMASAARNAATDPQTWVPLATAGLLIATDVDKDWSEDLAENQDFFGDDAEDISTNLRDFSTAAYLVTALAAPSDNVGDKIKGLSVGAATMVVDGMVSQGLKDLAGRERPNGANENSMPSGHASKAASRTAMAIRNLEYLDIHDWTRDVITWSLYGVAGGTGLARVEADKHYLSDVFVGYAVGQFVARFMHEAFFTEEQDISLSFEPVADGGALTLTVHLR